MDIESKKAKVNHILGKFPALSGHEDMVEFILELREVFNLEKVPFEVRVGNWSSGSLDKYYQAEAEKKAEGRRKAAEKRKAGQNKQKQQHARKYGYSRTPGFKL